jgi:A/G-specific adenine glycosylase
MAQRCAAHAAGTVAQHPAPRPKRIQPVRAVRMYLLVDEAGRCLLEQRPPSGIWGGLWTPPERAMDSQPESVCAEFGVPAGQIGTVTVDSAFRHTFTHFHLDVEPIRVRLAGSLAAVGERPGVCWYSPAAPRAIGLSAPAAKLLAGLSTASLSTARKEVPPP